MSGADYLAMYAPSGLLAALVVLYMRSIKADVQTVRGELQTVRGELNGKISEVDQRVDATADSKVDKREWVRESMVSRVRLDKALEGQARIEAKVEQAFGVGAAINKLAEVLAKRGNDGRHEG